MTYPEPPARGWHVGTRDRRYPARDIKPGQFLPPRRSWTEGFGQYVVSYERPEKGNLFGRLTLVDHDVPEDHPERIRVIQFAESSALYCPELRKDVLPEIRATYSGAPAGSIDWRVAGRIPKAHELQHGDVLFPRHPDPIPGQPHMDGEQRIARVSMNYDGRLILTLRDSKATRRFTCYPDEDVIFPRTPHTPRDVPNNVLDRRLSRASALVNAEVVAWRRNPHTGQVFRVIRHPYGRGQWPRDIPDFHPLLRHRTGLVITCKPPGDEYIHDFQLLEPCDPVADQPPRPTPDDQLDYSLIQAAMRGGNPSMVQHADD